MSTAFNVNLWTLCFLSYKKYIDPLSCFVLIINNKLFCLITTAFCFITTGTWKPAMGEIQLLVDIAETQIKSFEVFIYLFYFCDYILLHLKKITDYSTIMWHWPHKLEIGFTLWYWLQLGLYAGCTRLSQNEVSRTRGTP